MIDNENVRSTKDLVGRPVEVRVLFRAPLFIFQRLPIPKGVGSFFVSRESVPNQRSGANGMLTALHNTPRQIAASTAQEKSGRQVPCW